LWGESNTQAENIILSSQNILCCHRSDLDLDLDLINKTLKSLWIHQSNVPDLTDDEVKHLTSVVKKNYRLESLPRLDSADPRMRDVHSILRLNGAGRRYLKDGHGSVVSEGVGVLSAVSDDLNCVFLHLLENPSLCNRRASLKRSM
jgi:hypothetical protein